MYQSILAISKAFSTAFTASSVYDTTFSPSRFSMTAWNNAWNKTAADVGIRVFGATPDRNGILELGADYTIGATIPWHTSVQLLGTVATAPGSDFAAASTPDGGQIAVCFLQEDSTLACGQWVQWSRADTWRLLVVRGGAAPAANTSLAAALWGWDNLSVFYQDATGAIFESEATNLRWAAPRRITTATIGTDINVVRARTSTGLVKVVYVQDGTRVAECTQTGSTWSKTSIAAFPEQTGNVRFTVSYSDTKTNPGRIYYTSANGKMGAMQGSLGNWETLDDIPSLSNVAGDSDVSASLLFPGSSEWVWHVYTATDGTLWRQTYGQSPAKWRAPVHLVPSTS
ncbi:hypothetical protein EXIGLDRAFT_760169 [Exidia glandulosa HHB12029]|uniref:Fucose-specific lectin n=1 Tax=Exidia glandulosa HHB12029 TaxID=1314781 RepID=A0A165PBH4_EXIGL|nr:hypothetical protein EXIGLDRAFT_760169 [Exidia glandulosa HHB12029]